jgi:hypothetical protein
VKVYIGPYSHWFRPGQWYKDWMLWWKGFGRNVEIKLINIDDLDKATDRIKDSWIYDKLMDIENWVDNRVERKVRVKIHNYDVWSMDDTLSHIILPMLKLLKEKKQGYPHVEDEDVPEELRSTAATQLTEEQLNSGWPDDNGLPRWNWVMDEMIWAFEQMDPDADDQFFVAGYDHENHTKWQERKTRGFVLFGKYFQALWD